MYVLKDGHLWGDKLTKENGVEKVYPAAIDYGKAHFHTINPNDVFIRTMYSKGWIKKRNNMTLYVYSIEMYDEKKKEWHTDIRKYRGFKDSMEFDVTDVPGKRRNFKLIGKEKV